MNRNSRSSNGSACNDRMIETIRASEIFRDVTDHSLENMMKIMRPYYCDYDKNELLVRENELISRLAIVHSGKFVSVRNDYGGRASVIKEYDKADIIGLNVVFSRTKTSPTVIQATAPANCVIFIDLKTILSPLFPDKRLQYIIHTNLMRAISEDAVKNIYKLDIVTKKTIRERVLAYLFIIMKKSGSRAFKVDMDREHLAQYLGVARSALSHELSKMRRDGLIECDRDWFEIKEKCIEQYVSTQVSQHTKLPLSADEAEEKMTAV